MKYIALLGFLLLLHSCGRKSSLVTERPTVAEVEGRYTLAWSKFGESVDSEIAAKAANASIELMPDGTVLLSDVPLVGDSRETDFIVQRYHSGEGSFRIEPLGSTSESDFYGLHLESGDLPDPMGFPRLRIEDGEFNLSFDYFHGHFTTRMLFTRSSKKQAR